MNDFSFVACAPPACNCPVLEVEDNVVYITDDHGMIVQLSPEQMDLIATKWLLEYHRGK